MRNQYLLSIALIACCIGCSNDRPEVGKIANLENAAALRDDLFTVQEQAAEVATDLEPQDYVSFTGKFILDGSPPPSGTLNITKDVEVCLPGGGSIADAAVEVDAQTGGLKNVLIFADRVPAAWVHESAGSSNQERVFDQEECLFLDHVFALQTSQQLILKNSDPIGHNTKFEATGNPAVNVTLAAGETYPYTPKSAVNSPFEVTCSVHPWMKSYMIFRDNAYYAVTDAEGNFEIPNVPTGVPLTWRVWHDRATSIKTLKVGGEQVKLSRGSMERTFTPGTPAALEFTIDASQFK